VGFIASDPYYAWPSWLVVADDATVTSIDELAGATICVVSGSAGADWVAGTATGAKVQAPSGAVALEAADDGACFDLVHRGEAGAAVTATTFDGELAGKHLRALVADPVIVEPLVALVRGDAAGTDAVAFLTALDEAIGRLQASGQLAALSQRAFGGLDLTESLP
jgi:ABC-type amino acid transport substrate-binding protein